MLVLRGGFYALAAELDGFAWVLANLVLGADLNVAALGSALQQIWAVAFSDDNSRLFTSRTSFDGRALNRLAGRFAATALIIMDDDLVTSRTFWLFNLRARLLLARPFLAASIGFFKEFVTSSVASWRFSHVTRNHYFGVASAIILSLNHIGFTIGRAVNRLRSQWGAGSF